MIGWNDPDNASVLATIDDINFKSEGLIQVGIARHMDSDHISIIHL